jgi:hypothetical protein
MSWKNSEHHHNQWWTFRGKGGGRTTHTGWNKT